MLGENGAKDAVKHEGTTKATVLLAAGPRAGSDAAEPSCHCGLCTSLTSHESSVPPNPTATTPIVVRSTPPPSPSTNPDIVPSPNCRRCYPSPFHASGKWYVVIRGKQVGVFDCWYGSLLICDP